MIQKIAVKLSHGGVRSFNATRYANTLFGANITTIERLSKNFKNKPGFLESIFDKVDIEDITEALEVVASSAAMVTSSTVTAAAVLLIIDETSILDELIKDLLLSPNIFSIPPASIPTILRPKFTYFATYEEEKNNEFCVFVPVNFYIK